MQKSIKKDGKYLIIDDKNPNGRPENAQEQSLRLEAEKHKDEFSKISENIKNLKIPETKMKPAPMRIFVVEVTPETTFLSKELDIIMASTFDAGVKNDDTKSKVRYFCTAVGDEVKKQTFDGEKLEPGDEVMYMDIPDSVRVTIPEVYDYDLNDRTGENFTYKLFDVMEIAGIVKRKKEEKKEKSA